MARVKQRRVEDFDIPESICTPEQWFAPQKLSGSERLFVAIIADAVRNAIINHDVRDTNWLLSDTKPIRSGVTCREICETIGWNLGLLRRRVRAAMAKGERANALGGRCNR